MYHTLPVRIIMLNYTYTRTKFFDQQKVKRQIKPIKIIKITIYFKKNKRSRGT